MSPEPSEPFPSSPSAEKGILSCFLHNSSKVYPLCLSQGASPDWFSEQDRSTIFGMFMDMGQQGKTVDFITSINWILDHKIRLNTPVPDALLAELLSFVPNAAQIADYLGIVKRNAARKLAIMACQRVEAKLREECTDLQSVFDATAAPFTEVQGMCAEEETEDRDKIEVMNLLDDMERSLTGKADPTLMPFGLPTIDDMTGGGTRGELVVITGLPSVGKSLLGQRLVSQSVFNRNEQAQVFTMEMGHRQCLHRYVADLGNISLRSMRKKIFTQYEFNSFAKTLSKISGSGLRIYDIKRNKMTPQSIEAEIRKGKKNRGLDVVMADYLQLIRTKSNSEKRRDQELQDISKRFKLLAQELDIMFILLAQANEAGGCFDSSQVEADADWVMNLNPIFKNEGKIRRIVGTDAVYLNKCREGERGRKIPLTMKGEYARIEESSSEAVRASENEF